MTYRVLAIFQLLIMGYILYKSIKKQGMSLFGDILKIMFFLWLGNLALYNLQISKYYSPTILINITVLALCLCLYIASKKFELGERDVLNIIKIGENEKSYRMYSIITTGIFILASILFLINVNKYGLAILKDDKINKQRIDHYAGYVIYMLAFVAQVKYILFRNRKKILDCILCIGSMGILVLTLNRGPIAYVVIAAYIYELFRFVKQKKSMSKKKVYAVYGAFFIAFLAFVVFFGYIGDLRMENVLDRKGITIQEHYGISNMIPSSFVWIYVYLTSPLENAAFAIANQGVGMTFLNNLFYPFIKLFANIIGQGDAYKQWLLSKGQYTPYLWDKVGLNAPSFIPDAMQDLGIFGVTLYLAIYVAIAVLAIYAIKKRNKFSSVGALVLYANVVSIVLWSVFQNSLSIPILILNILLVLVIELGNSIFNKKRVNI